MTIKHVWHQSEIREVESEYGDHILLKSLRPASIVIANQAESFSLSPAELFYHAIHSLDMIKKRQINQSGWITASYYVKILSRISTKE